MYINISNIPDPVEFRDIMLYITEERREKTLRRQNEEDRKRSFAVGIMERIIFSELLNLSTSSKSSESSNLSGLSDSSDLYEPESEKFYNYSFSHSGDYAVAVFCTNDKEKVDRIRYSFNKSIKNLKIMVAGIKEMKIQTETQIQTQIESQNIMGNIRVGCDIDGPDKFKRPDLQRKMDSYFFSSRENKYLKYATETGDYENVIKLWTAKEACYKMSAFKGAKSVLPRLYTDIDNKEVILYDKCNKENDDYSKENDKCSKENDKHSKENDKCSKENDKCSKEIKKCRKIADVEWIYLGNYIVAVTYAKEDMIEN